jgi:hypothetical protein
MSAPFARELLARPPYRDFHPDFLAALEGHREWPAPEQYDELARALPQAAGVELPRFVTEKREEVRRAGGYEQHVAKLRSVPTRPGSWHDFFNMAVWAHFPKVRWALNALHVDPNVGPKDPRNGRAPAQNLAASFDESGVLVVSSSRLVLDELQALRFKRVFWEMRAEVVCTTRFWVVGHGLLEALLTPRAGLSARSLLLHMPSLSTTETSEALRFRIDSFVSEQVRCWPTARTILDPIPVLAIPGYCDNDSRDFYDDSRNIRFVPSSRKPRVAPIAIHE